VAGLCFVFLDGVGLGSDDAVLNPLAGRWPGLERLAGRRWTLGDWNDDAGDGLVVRRLDAALGHPGLPQSATGQTSLLTGRNAADVMRRHYGPWPGPTLQALLEQGTLFHVGVANGGALLANCYPPGYFAALERRRVRRSAPVHAALAAGLRLGTLDDYARGRAVAADFGGGFIRGSADAFAGAAPEEAVREQARRLAQLAGRHAFTFFDVWLTDHAGHAADPGLAHAVLARLDVFLDELAGAVPGEVTVLLTSDHGNLEDLRTPRHTAAPVPLLARGPGAAAFAHARSLPDVALAATALLGA
jgi:2,3-bisphosphoglycerate-independent phosphoglycerate mutase